MVQVIQQPGKFDAFADFGTVLGDVLKQQSAKKQQAQAQQEFQNILPNLDPNKPLNIQQTLQLQKLAQQAGYDPKAVMEAIKLNKPSNIQQVLQQAQNQRMDINPVEAPISNSAKPLIEATYQNLAPRPKSSIENLSDSQILALSSSPNPEDRAFADTALKLKEASRKDYIDNRDFHSKISDKFAQTMSDLESGTANIDTAIKEFEMGLQSGAGGAYSQDYWAQLFGEWGAGLVTPGGVLMNNATKKFLLADLEKVSAKGTNIFLEKRLTSTYGQLGRKKEVNEAWLETSKMKNNIDKAKVKAYKEISQFYEEKLGYVPRNIERLVDEATKDEIIKIGAESARNVQKIFESEKTDKQLLEDINKKVLKETPLTERNAQIFLNKFGKDAEKRAIERGYKTTLPDGTSIFKTLIRGDSPTPKEGEITNSEIIEQFGLEKRSIPQDVGIEFTEEAELPQIVKGVGQGIADIGLQAGMAPSLIQSLASSGLSPEARSQVATPGQMTEARRMTEPVSEAEFIRRASEGEDILPPVYTPGARSLLEETLSAPRGGLIEESARRATRNLPYLAGGPGTYAATAGRDILGQYAAEGAQVLGFGETGQNVADIAAGFIPSKSYVPSRKSAPKAEFLQKQGFTPQETSMILRKESTLKDIPLKFAKRSGTIQETVESAGQKFNDVFETLRASKGAQKLIPQKRVDNFTKSVENILKKAPVDVEKAIREDYSKFLESPQAGENLIDFYRAINKKIGNKKQLVALKPIIQKELQQLDGQLAKDFNLSNEVYAKFKDVSEKLKPTQVTDAMEQTAPWRFLKNLIQATDDGSRYMLMALGEPAFKKLMTAMVINPRYQNLLTKTVASINSGNIKGVEKLANQILSELAKDAPEAYEAMSGINQNSLQL